MTTNICAWGGRRNVILGDISEPKADNMCSGLFFLHFESCTVTLHVHLYLVRTVYGRDRLELLGWGGWR